jgi:hypothetical protein
MLDKQHRSIGMTFFGEQAAGNSFTQIEFLEQHDSFIEVSSFTILFII